MATYCQSTIEAPERRGGSFRGDLDTLNVISMSESGLRVAYTADEESPSYDVHVIPVTSGDELPEADHVVAGEQFAATFSKREQQ